VPWPLAGSLLKLSKKLLSTISPEKYCEPVDEGPISMAARRAPSTTLRRKIRFRPKVGVGVSGLWTDHGWYELSKWLPSQAMLSQLYMPRTLPLQLLKSLLMISPNDAPPSLIAEPSRPLLA